MNCILDYNHVMKLIQLAYFIIPRRSNQRRYQNELSAVNVMPCLLFPVLVHVVEIVMFQHVQAVAEHAQFGDFAPEEESNKTALFKKKHAYVIRQVYKAS